MREGPEQGVGSGCTSKCSTSRQHLILASPPSALPRPGCQAMSPFTTLSASTPAHEPTGPPHCPQGQGPSPRLGVRSRQRSLPDSSPALPFTVTRTDLLLRRGRFSLAASEYTFSFSFSLPAAHLSPSPSPQLAYPLALYLRPTWSSRSNWGVTYVGWVPGHGVRPPMLLGVTAPCTRTTCSLPLGPGADVIVRTGIVTHVVSTRG